MQQKSCMEVSFLLHKIVLTLYYRKRKIIIYINGLEKMYKKLIKYNNIYLITKNNGNKNKYFV